MASYQLVYRAERIAEVLLFSVTVADVAAADFGGVPDFFLLPADAPDVMIMEVMVQVSSVGTFIANPELASCVGFIFDSAGANVIDFVSAARMRRISASGAVAWLSPDPLVLMRKNEKMNLQFPDMDTSGTADLTVYLKAARLKPNESPAGPIQLVR